MRFKAVGDVEKPERGEDGRYYGVRSAERRDVRPNEALLIYTGIEVMLEAGEECTVISITGDEARLSSRGYQELSVVVANSGDRVIMLYPGQVIAHIEVNKISESGKARVKKAVLSSSATFDEAPQEPGFHKKPCGGCP